MFPSEIPRSFKYPFSEYENESTDLSYGSLSKPKDSPFYSNKDSNFYTAMNPKDSCFYSKDSTCYSKDYTREPVFYPRDSRRRTFIDEEYDPGVYKKICAEGCFDESRAKTTSFIDRKQENLSDKSWIHSSNTINFSNINSMTHFQRRPPMFNITMFEHKEEADKMIIPKENISFSGKNTNGLKSLSVRVREFVVKHKETSYKEIAEQLLKEIKRENRHSIEGAKEEQNIKRRIYDALNVLVATEIFKKKGKTVFYDGKSDVMGHDLMNKRVLGDKGELLKKNQDKKDSIQAKHKMLQSILMKNLAVKSLLNRNFILSTKRQDSNEKFQFPFLLMPMNSDSLTLKMNKMKNKLGIFSKDPLNLMGDMDVLIKLNFHKVEKSLIEKWFPKDVIHYLPENFDSEDRN